MCCVTAAGQVSVAVENARLFAEEQRRSRQLAFLNNISQTAISSDDPVQMLAEIASEIQKNFQLRSHRHRHARLRHQGNRDQSRSGCRPRTPRASAFPWERAFSDAWRAPANARWCKTRCREISPAFLPDSRAVLCIPITYGETLLGVLNVESRERKRVFSAGRADPEHAGRLAGDGAAQCVRLPETAAAVDHRRADRHQDPPLLLGSALGGVEARFAFRAPVLGGPDRSRQVQGSERHHGTLRRRPGAGARRTLARAEVAAVERRRALRWRRIHHPDAGDRRRNRRRFWPNACGSGSPPIPC